MVLFTVENTGDKPESFHKPELYDSEDRKFIGTNIFGGNFAPEGYEEEFLETLNPGLSKKLYQLYDVSEDASGFKWKWEGILDPGYEINLGL